MKNFINEYLPKYPDLELKYVPGKDPVILFLDEGDAVVETVGISKMSEDEIHELLISKGINDVASTDEESEDVEDEVRDDL